MFTGTYSTRLFKIRNGNFVPINGIMVLENVSLNDGILLKQTCKKRCMNVLCA